MGRGYKLHGLRMYKTGATPPPPTVTSAGLIKPHWAKEPSPANRKEAEAIVAKGGKHDAARHEEAVRTGDERLARRIEGGTHFTRGTPEQDLGRVAGGKGQTTGAVEGAKGDAPMEGALCRRAHVSLAGNGWKTGFDALLVPPGGIVPNGYVSARFSVGISQEGAESSGTDYGVHVAEHNVGKLPEVFDRRPGEKVTVTDVKFEK